MNNGYQCVVRFATRFGRARTKRGIPAIAVGVAEGGGDGGGVGVEGVAVGGGGGGGRCCCRCVLLLLQLLLGHVDVFFGGGTDMRRLVEVRIGLFFLFSSGEELHCNFGVN